MTAFLKASFRVPSSAFRVCLIVGSAIVSAPHDVDAIETLVADVAEFDAAVKAAKPGDAIVLKNGEWRDAELKFRGEGLRDEGKRITLRAETPGNVVFTGTTRLRIGGEYLEVKDLFWRDAAAESEVISFRIDSKTHARHCFLNDCAIIGDLPDKERKWVSLYGESNYVESCRFEGKQSGGTLLVVWLPETNPDDPVAKQVYHHVVNNFFGPRSNLGKNGGEIIRVGDSKTSQQLAGVFVSTNYFYQCDGDAEIISNKSGGNYYRYNVFVGCGGALTLRHGNLCVVSNNAFFGDGRKGTGGVRVIGERHEVKSNLFYELTGDDTRAAVSIMSGIPDSPLNGYFQVKRASIDGNTFIRCKETFVVGLRDKDQKHQSLPPIDSLIKDNAVLSPDRPVFDVHNEPKNFRQESNAYVGDKLGLDANAGWRQFPDAPKFDLAAGTTLRTFEGKFDLDDFTPLALPSDVGPAWMKLGEEYLPEVLRRNGDSQPLAK